MSAAALDPILMAVNASTAADPLPLMDPRAWTGPAPPRRWIVPDWISRGVVTGLYGDGGVGKSLLAQQLATSVALGLPWLGLDTVPGRAVAVFCEDEADELHRRQQAINATLGVEPANLENLRLLSRLGDDNTLFAFDGDRGHTTPFFDRLDATCRAFKPALLILDTAADLFGGNENDRPKVRAFIGACLGRLARDHQAAVLLCAHPSAAGLRDGSGTGGSTAWNNTLRARLYLTRPQQDQIGLDDDRRILSRQKSNYSAIGTKVEMVWTRGVFTLPEPGRRMDDAATWPAIGAMFDELDRAWTAGRAWSFRKETRKAGRYFPAWAKQHLGIPEDRTAGLLADWQMNGCLSFEMFDRSAKTRGLRVIRRPDQ